ncbi:MBL fold metallo-hydrolase [uncultured Friedmanniella sp.]|uniref:MBL fold metallo-hydrolase n=1 Tax=uncultured Friedmanniella sp. TaxID=335381 RepID=UPI0035CB4B66
MQQQARAPQSRPFGPEAFEPQEGTVPRLDAVLVTHSDNDHVSVPTCRALATVTTTFHSTRYVDTLARAEGLPSAGHAIGDRFAVGDLQVEVTPADRAWQNDSPGATVWAPGDSRLIPEHHLAMPAPDAMLFDFSDSSGTSASTVPPRWPTPTPTRACCCSTGAASTPRTSAVQRRPRLTLQRWRRWAAMMGGCPFRNAPPVARWTEPTCPPSSPPTRFADSAS